LGYPGSLSPCAGGGRPGPVFHSPANSTKIVKCSPDLKFHEVIKVADLPIAAVVRIARKSGAERVGSDAAAALVA